MPYRYHRPRTVIITGASAGVGRAIAQRFARAGDRIGLIARDDSALQDVQRGLQAVGAEAAWEAADVANAVVYFASDASALVTGAVMDLEQYPVGAPPNF